VMPQWAADVLMEDAAESILSPDVEVVESCGCRKVLRRLCDLRIFVQEAAESIPADDRGVGVSGWVGEWP